jgi:hypothetical protein
MHLDKIKGTLFLSLILLLITKSSFAQESGADQAFAYEHKELWFDQIVKLENTSLINGPEYFIPFQAATTHPFFGSRELTNEELQYDHQRYINIPLLYDIFSDILILRIQDKNNLFAMVQIDKTKVEGFTLFHHQFKKLTNPKESGSNSSYFEILYEGKNIMLVAKRIKGKHILDGRTEFQQEDKFYFIRNNQWAHLTGNSSYYELMKNDKVRILAFIKSQNIKVRKQNERDMIAIADFCNSLEETTSN